MKNQRKQAQKQTKPSDKEVVTFELEKVLIPHLKQRAKRFERSMSGHLRVLVKEDLKPQTV